MENVQLKENINVSIIENFLCRYLGGLIVINEEVFKLLDFEILDEYSLRLKVKDEHKQQYYIYIEDIIKVIDNFFNIYIQLENNKTLIIEEY